MSLREEVIAALIAAKIPSPRLEADIILKHATPNYPKFTENEIKIAQQMLQRRLQNEPLDKIVGKREFYKSVFKVNSDVLSPRPDTEILVESALSLIPQEANWQILDLGTGSGCILLSLLGERPQCSGIGVDTSVKALQVAQQNADNLNLTFKAKFINKNWTERNFINQQFELIVSNPPYIPTAEIETLEIEVKKYDPIQALDGGKDGLDCYREIAAIAPLILKQNGYILLEVGYNQAQDVENIFAKQGLTPFKIVPDLAGINRCVILKK
ncbi:MAG: peptide chain release factor N(5)-glutamine methyltransferase [Acetobacter sp.]|nr:peptide chain release factor N(5)-glutamine methyltransferase [Acetobacter sp.]